MGSYLFICGFIIPIITDFFLNGGEYVQYRISNQLSGTYWWAFWIEIFPGYLLPQILLVGKFRNTIISTVIIMFFWWAVQLLIKMASSQQGWHIESKSFAIECIKEILIYLLALIGVYVILSRRKKQLEPSSTNL